MRTSDKDLISKKPAFIFFEKRKKYILRVSTKKTSPIIGDIGILLNLFYQVKLSL